MGRINVTLLTNFLEALTLSGTIPRRFVLQTGAKHYGLHLGPPLTAEAESDPLLQGDSLCQSLGGKIATCLGLELCSIVEYSLLWLQKSLPSQPRKWLA
jgi:hypothetical protein